MEIYPNLYNGTTHPGKVTKYYNNTGICMVIKNSCLEPIIIGI